MKSEFQLSFSKNRKTYIQTPPEIFLGENLINKKRGAIELSMTTIIVIVIGVTLLSLGLIFVRGVFNKVEGLSRGAFDQAQGEIGKIGQVDSFINLIPPKIELKQKDSTTADLVLANLESADIKVQASISSKDTKVVCAFADTLETTSKQYLLSSGDEVKVKIYIEDKGSPLGLKFCNVDVAVQGAQIADTSDELTIDVIKK